MTQSAAKSTSTEAEETSLNEASAPVRRRVLLTGFEPFGGEASNPSGDLARKLDGWRPMRDVGVTGIVLPCVFGESIAVLGRAITRLEPELVIAIGQAGSRHCLSIERIAVNVDDARIPDNIGRQPIDEPVLAGAPAAYFSTLPIKAVVQALRCAGIPAEVSQTAGTFVCNHVFFGLAHRLASGQPQARGGFIHVPRTPQQAAALPDAPSMSLDTMEQGIRLAVSTCLSTAQDLRLVGGAID